MRLLLIALLVANVLLALYVVNRQKNASDVRKVIAEEAKKALILQRENDQLQGEYNASRGKLEDEMIARDRLNMHTPQMEPFIINVPPQPSPEKMKTN